MSQQPKQVPPFLDLGDGLTVYSATFVSSILTLEEDGEGKITVTHTDRATRQLNPAQSHKLKDALGLTKVQSPALVK